MKFSTKTRYGIRTMLEIASSADEKGVFQKDISVNQDISNKYLDQIIHALKVANLICPVRGKKSGYLLTRPPEKITMLDIHNAFEPGIYVVDCLVREASCNRTTHCASRNFWEKLNNQITDTFTGTTLADLLATQNKM